LTTLDRKVGFGTNGCMRIWAWTYGAIWAAMCLPLDAYAAPAFLPDCAGRIEIANAKVVRITPDGTLILPADRVAGRHRLPWTRPHCPRVLTARWRDGAEPTILPQAAGRPL
jgi:hypothetical protein